MAPIGWNTSSVYGVGLVVFAVFLSSFSKGEFLLVCIDLQSEFAYKDAANCGLPVDAPSSPGCLYGNDEDIL